MSLWGPALDAEIEYRQSEARKAWGGKRTSRSDRTDRTARHEKSREKPHEKHAGRPSRTEQIGKGIAGMRPASSPRHGLFA
ncbi:hypothetical protein ACFT2C_17105 [Promicromonospora sp. NPDC057138]|uniref:hypothetical protein n=1 Tax=Promicromonospora sp. NPDC057138 TaxID=3346031 RepID=UPI0036453196